MTWDDAFYIYWILAVVVPMALYPIMSIGLIVGIIWYIVKGKSND